MTTREEFLKTISHALGRPPEHRLKPAAYSDDHVGFACIGRIVHQFPLSRFHVTPHRRRGQAAGAIVGE